MKKIVTLIAAVIICASASAQVVFTNDFEDGTAGAWKFWGNKEASILGADQAKDSKYALDLFTGGYCIVKGLQAGSTYAAYVDAKWVRSDAPGVFAIQAYDAEAKKLANLKETELPMESEYKTVKLVFKAKGGQHRVSLTPTEGKPCRYVIDNIKVEKIK